MTQVNVCVLNCIPILNVCFDNHAMQAMYILYLCIHDDLYACKTTNMHHVSTVFVRPIALLCMHI